MAAPEEFILQISQTIVDLVHTTPAWLAEILGEYSDQDLADVTAWLGASDYQVERGWPTSVPTEMNIAVIPGDTLESKRWVGDLIHEDMAAADLQDRFTNGMGMHSAHHVVVYGVNALRVNTMSTLLFWGLCVLRQTTLLDQFGFFECGVGLSALEQATEFGEAAGVIFRRAVTLDFDWILYHQTAWTGPLIRLVQAIVIPDNA